MIKDLASLSRCQFRTALSSHKRSSWKYLTVKASISEQTFWGGTLEEELVLSLDGPRAVEAFVRLRQLASMRKVHVGQIICEVHAFRAANSESHVADIWEPKIIYAAGECPICMEGADLGALACGHALVICKCTNTIC